MTLTLQYAAGEDERHRLHHAQDRHEEPMEVGVFANSNKVMTPKNKKNSSFYRTGCHSTKYDMGIDINN